MKKLFTIFLLAVAAAAYFSHLDTRISGVCYASDCPDGCGGGGSDDPDGTGGGGDDSGPDGTGDGGGSGGSGSDPDGSGGGGDF
ncbi:MAG: hypothetical protein A3I76_02285 [Elusimicrobia bacterium RIFCSPLOWO2_02_FULL_61_11]|nr:MAG: hypothetical protein A3I76_02285 [Elusimicrobia bacterium RIFCSPLOWO2_02_FULL_61_11]